MSERDDARARLTVAIVQTIVEAGPIETDEPMMERAEAATALAHAIIEEIIESSGCADDLLLVMGVLVRSDDKQGQP